MKVFFLVYSFSVDLVDPRAVSEAFFADAEFMLPTEDYTSTGILYHVSPKRETPQRTVRDLPLDALVVYVGEDSQLAILPLPRRQHIAAVRARLMLDQQRRASHQRV